MREAFLHYILEGTTPVPIDCSTAAGMAEWGQWFQDPNARRMFRTEVNGQLVSTVFLSINHQYGDGPPVLFETMIFAGSSSDEYCERYHTYDQAHAGHILAVAMLKGERLPRKKKKRLKKWRELF